MGKKGRKLLQTNPGILKTTHLACNAWVRAPTFNAVISCHSCIGGQILPTRINNNHWKLIYVSRTIPSSQYETNLWSTHVNIVRLAEPIRRCVRWRTQVFKIEGFVCKRFLPSPPPPPTFIFWLLFHFTRGQNRESRFSVFLCSETKRKRFYAGYSSIDLHIHQSSDLQIHRSSHPQIYRSPSDLLIHRSSDLQNHRSTKPPI